MKRDFICCLCGAEVKDSYGNNPYPLNKSLDDRCCDRCNVTKVIPARLVLIERNRNEKK